MIARLRIALDLFAAGARTEARLTVVLLPDFTGVLRHARVEQANVFVGDGEIGDGRDVRRRRWTDRTAEGRIVDGRGATERWTHRDRAEGNVVQTDAFGALVEFELFTRDVLAGVADLRGGNRFW